MHDNAGLFHAQQSGLPVLPVFIFDRAILDQLEDEDDRRVTFIYDSLQQLNEELQSLGSSLYVFNGYPLEMFEQLTSKFSIQEVFTNHDYELYSISRDSEVEVFLNSKGIAFNSYKDHVVFEKNEVVKADGKPYTVFTPYSKAWLRKLESDSLPVFHTAEFLSNFYRCEPMRVPDLNSIGFVRNPGPFPPKKWKQEVISKYDKTRDYPAISGTSKVGVHLRFGTVSIRELVAFAREYNAVYLGELIWREFYQSILHHFPHIKKGLAFKPAYDKIEWRNNEEEFKRWCQGTTGYPVVDAGMRELNATGFMHNRVRMITASFLTKHLLIDWRWGEAYFAQKLLDYEFASNNGGWQWAAGSGCDAAPYFRIFNPYLQTKRFDKDLVYVRKWVPEFEDCSYPAPIIEHEFARKRALQVYGKALKDSG